MIIFFRRRGDEEPLTKAVVQKQVWIAGYTKHNGRYVQPHYGTVNASTDHDDHKVASGQGKEYEKKAHAHLSKQDDHKALPVEHQAANILHLATSMQKKASHASNVNTFKNKILAGGNGPTPAEWKSFLSAKKEKISEILGKFKEARKLDHYQNELAKYEKKTGVKEPGTKAEPAPVVGIHKNSESESNKKDKALQSVINHLEEDSRQSDLPKEEKAEDKELVTELKSAKESVDAVTQAKKLGENANANGYKKPVDDPEFMALFNAAGSTPKEMELIGAWIDEKDKVSAIGVNENADKKDSPIHASALSKIASLPSGNYKKQAHNELSAHPDWQNWSDREKHDKIIALYHKKQSAATAAGNVVKFKKAIKSGKAPSPAQMAAVMALPSKKYDELIESLAKEVGGHDKLAKLFNVAEKDAKKEGISYEPATGKDAGSKPESNGGDDDPKEGDTKEGADGILVFKDGRWHKQGVEQKAVKIPSFEDVMALKTLPKDQMKAKMKEYIAEAGYDEFKSLLEKYKKQAIDEIKNKKPEPSALKDVVKKEPKVKKDYGVGDAVDHVDIKDLPPGTILQLYFKGEKWKQALMGHGSVFLSKKGGGFYKNGMGSSNLSSFYYSKDYSDEPPTIIEMGHNNWMSEAQKKTVESIIKVKQSKGNVANVYQLHNQGHTIVVGDMDNKTGLFWVDDEGKYAAGFNSTQKKLFETGGYDVLDGFNGDESVKSDEPVKTKEPAKTDEPDSSNNAKDEWTAKVSGYKKVHVNGEDWYVINTGDVDASGNTYAHLASVDNGVNVKNGWNPKQMADYINLDAVEVESEITNKDSNGADGASNAIEIKQFTHSKKGHTVFAVSLSKKLDDDEYKNVAAMAKQYGGFYSSFKKDGAIPGFHFKDEDKAKDFAKMASQLINGNVEHAEAESAYKQSISEKIQAGLNNLNDFGYITAFGKKIVNDWLDGHPHDLAGAAAQLKDYSYYGSAEQVKMLANDLGLPTELQEKPSPIEVSINDQIKNAGSQSAAADVAEAYFAKHGESVETYDAVLTALDMQGYGKLANDFYDAMPEDLKAISSMKLANPKKTAQAPVGIEVSIDGEKYTKTADGKWTTVVNAVKTSLTANVPAALELISGHIPVDEWFNTKSDNHKEAVVEMASDNGVPVTVALNKVFPVGEHGPSEGDTKTINEVTYILQNGRWHKMGSDESAEEAQKSITSIADLKIPEGLPNNWSSFLTKLKESVEANGADGLSITVTQKYITVKNKGVGQYGKAKVWNPLYNTNINDKDKEKLQLLLSLKSLSGGNTHAGVTEWLGEQGYPVHQPDGKKPKKKAKKKIAIPKATGEVVAKEVVSAGITKIDTWEKVGEQKGSNDGGTFKDSSGNNWYCKFPSSADVVKNELLAAKFYQMMGVSVPNLKLVDKDGKLGIASKWVDGLSIGSSDQLAKAPGVRDSFAIDAWLGNWDVVGLSNDNLMLGKDGKAVHVDVGGALLYRAMGTPKGSDFGNQVTELKTLLDPVKNSKTAAVFSGMSQEDVAESAKKVAKIKPSQIRKMVEMFGPGDESAKKALAEKLIARRRSIIDQLGIDDPWDARSVDETNLVVDTNALPSVHDFHNWNGPGKGLSSVKKVNDMNIKAEQDILDFAKKGNLVNLKNYQFMAIDKDSGKELGLKSINQHPSQHVQALWSECVSVLDTLAHPSIDSYDMPGVTGALEDISEGAGYFDFGASIDTVSAEKRFGFWLKVSHAIDIDDVVPKAITHGFESVKNKGYEWYAGISSLTKQMISGIQGSGTYNDAFRDGKDKTQDGASTVKMTAQAYADALEMDEGTEIYRWLHLPPAMVTMFNNSEKGMILQNPGSMCCSVDPTATQHFGSNRLKIRYAKGAKALNSYGSGSFKSEMEITTLPGARFVVLSVKQGNPKGGGLDIELMMLPPASGYVEAVTNKASMLKSFVIYFTKKINELMGAL